MGRACSVPAMKEVLLMAGVRHQVDMQGAVEKPVVVRLVRELREREGYATDTQDDASSSSGSGDGSGDSSEQRQLSPEGQGGIRAYGRHRGLRVCNADGRLR